MSAPAQGPGPAVGGTRFVLPPPPHQRVPWNPADAFGVVEEFERAVAAYTGAPLAVAVDSCTNALFLCLLFRRLITGSEPTATLPRRTYVGVAQAVLNAGFSLGWREEEWAGEYEISRLQIWDAAKRFTSGMWRPPKGQQRPRGRLVCVSFQAYKILPIGRGGAILTADPKVARWLRRARHDGRAPGYEDTGQRGWHCYMPPPDAARGLWLMTGLAKQNPDLLNDHVDISRYAIFRRSPA